MNASFEHFNFNTAIAALMIFVNEATKHREALAVRRPSGSCGPVPLRAAHLRGALVAAGARRVDRLAAWPAVDPEYLSDDRFELVVQVNGKLRARVEAPKEADKGELEALAREAAQEQLAGKEVKRAIVVPGRLVNFVV